MDSRIDEYFKLNCEQMIEDISSLIAVKSVKEAPKDGCPFGEGPFNALMKVIEIAERLGFKAVNVDNYAAHFDINDKEPILGILAHLDVVAEGDGWNFPPYEGTVSEGKIFGRGAADDKGPAIAALYALAAAREIEPKLSKGARVILGTDEETGSADIAYYRTKIALPPNVFSPDADYPVINVEKGRYSPVFGKSFTNEQRLPCCSSFKGGKTVNIVPHYAEAELRGVGSDVLSDFCSCYSELTGVTIDFEMFEDKAIVRAIGKSAHGSAPMHGLNAQSALLSMLAAMPLADGEITAAIKALTLLFPHGDWEGNGLGVKQKDELTGELTLSFNKLVIDENAMHAQFDCRCPECSTKTLCATVEEKLGKAGFDVIDNKELIQPHQTPADSPFVQTLLRIYEDYTGMEGKCLAIGGGTYVHDIDGGVAFGCSMPGTDNRMHGADEFAVIDELILSAKMFTQVILDMCK